ncbi:MAG: YbaK/EbsC family protein [Candidatus Aenigmatarchaeota archaeon]
MDVFSELVNILVNFKVDFEIMSHRPVTTSEEAALVRGTTLESGAKAIVAKIDRFVLFVLPANLNIDSKKVKKIFKTKNFRFATDEELYDITSCKKGAVPPFGNIFGLETFVDQELLKQKKINFNAGRNDKSIKMKTEDYLKIVKPKIEKFSQV